MVGQAQGQPHFRGSAPPQVYGGERFAAPTLEFDPAHADLKIALSPQLFEIEQAAGATSMWVQITAPRTIPGG